MLEEGVEPSFKYKGGIYTMGKVKDVQTAAEVEELDSIEEEVIATPAAMITIRIFKTAYNSDHGVLHIGTKLEIPEADFDKWSNTATEVED